MLDVLYKKSNDLFQSKEWAAFQGSLGRSVIKFDNFIGYKIPFWRDKSFIWVEKAPTDCKSLFKVKEIAKKEQAVFVRLEPARITNKLSLRRVSRKSLLSGQCSPKATLVLDLAKTEEKVLAGMKPKTRYNIRLAAKKGVRVYSSADPEASKILFEMLQKTAEKNKGFASHKQEYYKKMMECLGPQGLAKIFVAEFEGKPQAAILVSFYGKVATYLHGGSSDEKKELMAPYLCQWEAIREAMSQGATVYDFWGVAETDDPNDSWAGITRFKQGFGGEKIVFPGCYDLVVNSFWYNLLTLAAKLKRVFK